MNIFFRMIHMTAILGKKLGMTSVFDDKGESLPCTVIEAGPCYVAQIKTKEKDGYERIGNYKFAPVPK